MKRARAAREHVCEGRIDLAAGVFLVLGFAVPWRWRPRPASFNVVLVIGGIGRIDEHGDASG